MYEPKLLEVEGEAVGGCVSEDLGGGGDLKAVFVGLDILVVLEVFEEKPEIDQLGSFAVGFKSEPN